MTVLRHILSILVLPATVAVVVPYWILAVLPDVFADKLPGPGGMDAFCVAGSAMGFVVCSYLNGTL